MRIPFLTKKLRRASPARSAEEEDPIDDKPMPLLEHLIELRTRLMWSLGAFLLAFFVCYHFSAQTLRLPRPAAGRTWRNGSAAAGA